MIDLDQAHALCPGLPADSAEPLCFRAMIALQRRHTPGTLLLAAVCDLQLNEPVTWTPRAKDVADTEDVNRVTEEASEAVALAIAGSHRAWRVVRRLQSTRGEGADWLMRDASGRTIVMEIGGTDEGDITSLLKRKLRQARESVFARVGESAACVVRFLEPKASLQDNG